MLHSLEVRDYSFWDSANSPHYEDALALGREAPYYIGLHLLLADKKIEARSMFEVGARKSPEPFKTLCLEELTTSGTAAEKFEAVEHLLAQKNLGDKALSAFETQRGSLLLELGRFEDVPFGVPSWYYSHPLTASLVSSFSSLPTSYPKVFYDITASRINVYQKSYQKAWLQAKAVLDLGAPECFERSVLSDFGKAALYGSNDYPSDAVYFNQLFEKTTISDAKYISAFYAGRLFGRTGPAERSKAEACFKLAMTYAQTDADYDSALWYLLEMSIKESTDSFFVQFEHFGESWKNPAKFSDILEESIVQLVQKQDWKRLIELRRILPETADKEISTRLDYIAARSGMLSESQTADAFTYSFEGDHNSFYYRVLSAEALDVSIGNDAVIVSSSKNSNKYDVHNETKEAEKNAAKVLRFFITYKLSENVYPFMVKKYPIISVPLASELSTLLNKEGRYSDALRIMMTALRSTDAPITDDDLRVVYPRPWLAEVSEASARFNIPEYVLYALIRSESYFQADVRSTVGAVGLSQLMKPTAADIARKLHLEVYDLSDPKTNITFGAFYLSELIGRLDGHLMPSFFAYNAGITRVRSWQKTTIGLKDDLFLETLPYAETREYGRKVLAAAAVYGYLYYQKTTGQIVREIF